MSIYTKNEKLYINISNEALDDFRGFIKIAVRDNSFNTLYASEHSAEVSSLSAADIFSVSLSEYITAHEKERFVCVSLFNSDGERLSSETMIFTKPKYYSYCNPNITYSVNRRGEYTILTVRSDKYAKSVCIDFTGHDFILSDNFFDIASHEPVEIYLKADIEPQELLGGITLRSMYDLAAKTD